MFRDLISTLGSWAKPPLSTFSTSGAWCSFLESLVQYTLLGPSLLWGGLEDRSRGLFPSPGRQLPIEAVSDLVALFFAHLADTSFLTPADSLWLLVPVAGNPVLQMLPLLCLSLHCLRILLSRITQNSPSLISEYLQYLIECLTLHQSPDDAQSLSHCKTPVLWSLYLLWQFLFEQSLSYYL